MKIFLIAFTVLTATGGSASAQEYPAPTLGFPIQRSMITNRDIVIPPYRHLFHVRVYTTAPQQPYYNVPPYAVIAPY